MDPEQFLKKIQEVIREEVRLAVREALHEEQTQQDKAERVRSLKKTATAAVAAALVGQTSTDESFI